MHIRRVYNRVRMTRCVFACYIGPYVSIKGRECVRAIKARIPLSLVTIDRCRTACVTAELAQLIQATALAWVGIRQ